MSNNWTKSYRLINYVRQVTNLSELTSVTTCQVSIRPKPSGSRLSSPHVFDHLVAAAMWPAVILHSASRCAGYAQWPNIDGVGIAFACVDMKFVRSQSFKFSPRTQTIGNLMRTSQSVSPQEITVVENGFTSVYSMLKGRIWALLQRVKHRQFSLRARGYPHASG